MSDLLNAALTYRKEGFSVIPIQTREKKPLTPWEKHQTRKATKEEARAWWRKWPEANIGIAPMIGVPSALASRLAHVLAQ